MLLAARASRRLGLTALATFSGALLWHTVYPWPQRPAQLVEDGFAELARRGRPILDAYDDSGIDVCFEIHPGEDLHDGASFERFLDVVSGHSRANIFYDPSHLLLQMDYVAFLDIYHERIRMMHVKDAEFRPNGRSGVYGGYQSWIDRRPVPLARRRSDRFWRDLLEAGAVRLSRLGRGRMGMRVEGRGCRRTRRRDVRPPSPHPDHRPRLRRFRRRVGADHARNRVILGLED